MSDQLDEWLSIGAIDHSNTHSNNDMLTRGGSLREGSTPGQLASELTPDSISGSGYFPTDLLRVYRLLGSEPYPSVDRGSSSSILLGLGWERSLAMLFW